MRQIIGLYIFSLMAIAASETAHAQTQQPGYSVNIPAAQSSNYRLPSGQQPQGTAPVNPILQQEAEAAQQREENSLRQRYNELQNRPYYQQTTRQHSLRPSRNVLEQRYQHYQQPAQQAQPAAPQPSSSTRQVTQQPGSEASTPDTQQDATVEQATEATASPVEERQAATTTRPQTTTPTDPANAPQGEGSQSEASEATEFNTEATETGEMAEAALPKQEIRLIQLSFIPDHTSLNTTHKAAIKQLINRLKEEHNLDITLNSYATAPDTAHYTPRRNALKRAVALRDYLVKKSVDETRIHIRALASNEADEPLNRIDITTLQ